MVGLIGAMLLLGSYLLFLFANRKYGAKWYLFLAGIVLVVLLVPFAYYIVVSQMSEEAIKSSRFLNLLTWQAWAGRLMPWQLAWDSIQDAFWLGFGAGSSYNLFFEYLPADARLYVANPSYDHVHNEWLEIMQEGGVFALLMQFVVVLSLFYVVIFLLKSDELSAAAKKMVLGIGLGVAAYLFHGTFSLATRMTINEFSFYTLIAVLVMFFGRLKKQKMGSWRSGRWWAGGALVAVWVVGYPGLLGGYEARQIQLESTQTAEESLSQIERYKDSESVDALHRLVTRQLIREDTRHAVEVLDRIEEKVRNFRNVRLLRALEYYLSSGSEGSVSKFKEMLLEQWERDRYHYPTLHWLIRIAAMENNQDEVLRYMHRLFQHQILSAKVLPYSMVDSIEARTHDVLDGVALDVSDRGAVLFIGKETVKELMFDLRQNYSKDQLEMVYKEYAKRVFLKIGGSAFSGEDSNKIKRLFEKFLSVLVGWSVQPEV